MLPLATRTSLALTWLTVGLAACGDDESKPAGDSADSADGADGADTDAADTSGPDLSMIVATPGTQALMDFTLAGGFYSAPWPSEARRGADGRPDLSGFPDNGNTFVRKILALLERDADGFSVSSMITFTMTAPVDVTRLPDAAGSVARTSTIALVSVDRDAPDYLVRYPVVTVYQPDAGPFGAPRLLSILPYQGIPLRSHTTYAAVALRSLRDDAGAPLGVPAELAALARGEVPAGMSASAAEQHRAALVTLAEDGLDLTDLAALTVFRTGDPRGALRLFREDLLSRPLPEPKSDFALTDVYDDFCVYGTRLDFPTYQAGEPPFLNEGGGWLVDDAGRPILQGTEEGHLIASIPRRAMPAAGYPVVIFVRAGGGGDRPLIDRGVHAEVHGSSAPGTGPAVHLARAGWAGLQGDGPNGGLRNISGADENALLYSVTNPEALRDNLRESALEQSLMANMLEGLTIDASDCPGATSPATFDAQTVALMGHSNGAWITPMALAAEPIFKGAVLSGAGGSWIENLVYKQSPLPLKPVSELLLGYRDREVHRHDPALNLLQWAGEPADPALYGRAIIDEPPAGGAPRHILMFQGIVDTYILPTIAHASSLAMRLDLAGTPKEADAPALAEFATLPEVLPMVGRRVIPLPAEGNIDATGGAKVTAAVVQHFQDPVEDGHEAMFQLEGPMHQYRCFFASLAEGGVPRIPEGGAVDDACP